MKYLRTMYFSEDRLPELGDEVYKLGLRDCDMKLDANESTCQIYRPLPNVPNDERACAALIAQWAMVLGSGGKSVPAACR